MVDILKTLFQRLRSGVLLAGDFRDISIHRRDVFVAENREVREHACKVVSLSASRSASRSLRCDAVDQRDLHSVMERSSYTTVLERVRTEKVLRVEVKSCCVAVED